MSAGRIPPPSAEQKKQFRQEAERELSDTLEDLFAAANLLHRAGEQDLHVDVHRIATSVRGLLEILRARKRKQGKAV